MTSWSTSHNGWRTSSCKCLEDGAKEKRQCCCCRRFERNDVEIRIQIRLGGRTGLHPFIPAKAGIQFCPKALTIIGQDWVPAFAGTNGGETSLPINPQSPKTPAAVSGGNRA